MGILEFLECFDPLTEICVEDATEVVFEGRAEDFPEEKDKAYIIVPSRTNNRDGVIRLFVSKQEYLEKKCGQNKIYVLDALLAILYSVMRKNSEAKQVFLTMVEKAEDYNEILQKWEKAPEKEKEPLEREKQGDGKLFWRKRASSSGNETNRTTLGYFGSVDRIQPGRAGVFAEYLVRRRTCFWKKTHAGSTSWAQCHEDELCQIMKADYPNEGIAALALESSMDWMNSRPE